MIDTVRRWLDNFEMHSDKPLRDGVKGATRQCRVCGRQFTQTRSNHRSCSTACAIKACARYVPKQKIDRCCELCGANFKSARDGQRFCTERCRRRSSYDRNKPTILESQSRYRARRPEVARLARRNWKIKNRTRIAEYEKRKRLASRRRSRRVARNSGSGQLSAQVNLARRETKHAP